ncbi:MAG: alpha/beta hydrolase [Asgard group archaeon]|nr:alpha/beta hydrolase [Asgard group archaeon]
MNNWTSDYINVNSLNLHYTRTGGDKPPLILLHGYADNGLCWTRAAQVFEKEFDVIMPDFRNHGLSSISSKGIDSYEMMQEIAELIKTLELDKTWILGHSMGARITSLLAKEYSPLVKGIVLVEPAFNFKPSLTFREIMIYFAFSMRLSSMRNKTEEEIIERSTKQNTDWNIIDQKSWARAQYQFAQLKQKPSLRQLRTDRVLYREVLPYIKVPILLMVAENGVIPKKYFQSLKDSFQEGEWVLYEQTGYNIQREQFDSFINTVRNFVQS